MKYSIEEIDRMRTAIKHSYPTGIPYLEEERSKEVEDQLRTYMINETTVEELEAWSKLKQQEDDINWNNMVEIQKAYSEYK